MANGTTSTKRFWTPLRLAATFVVLGFVALFGATSCNSTDPATKSNPATGSLTSVPTVVRESQLKIANGSTVKISDYSGKVIFVNLWATWCGPCRMEVPELVALNKEYKLKGVEMIGLSTEDPDESSEKVKQFITAFNMDYQVGWAPREVALALMQERNSIPQSFVFTRDGKIYKRFVGYSPQIVPMIRKALDEALKM